MCDITQRQVADILKKDATLVNRYIKKYQNLDVNWKADAIILEKMSSIKQESLKQIEIN
jgi:adenine deaminase